MTQQDIINELNRMVIGYNINWDMIKYDADRAIMKINAHLGAEYPMMSAVMLSPQHRYTIKVGTRDVPIFPERYILTVVIPFIASEVLARDEEFTTIYNKYVMDFDNGLFDMFQNEFNKVPPVFRQDKDVGVFFSKDIKEYKIHEDRDRDLPTFEFKVYYHFNVKDYYPLQQFTIDTQRYKYGTDAVVLDATIKNFINDIYAYSFSGWATSPTGETIMYNVGENITNITEDIHLFAQWNKECVLKNSATEGLSIEDKYKSLLNTLIIPPYVDGILVKTISKDFNVGADKLISVTLPRTNLTIKSGAFNNTALRTLILPSYDYLRNYPSKITIEANAIQAHSIPYLYIPYSVSDIVAGAINNVPVIRCEIETKPNYWEDGWYTGTDVDVEWGVANG